MPFCLSHSSSSKYSSIQQQKFHENQYKKFLNTLPNIHQQSSNKILGKSQQINVNRNYFLQRENQLYYRQEKRKHEYERIEKENLRFSQRLINAKSCFDRSEQEAFFNRHCKLKQRLQHYPDSTRNQAKKHRKTMEKPADSSFLIYHDHRIVPNLLRQTASLYHTDRRISKFQESSSIKQKPLSIPSDIVNSKISANSNCKTQPKVSEKKPSSNIIDWNSTKHSPVVQTILFQHDLSSSSELSI